MFYLVLMCSLAILAVANLTSWERRQGWSLSAVLAILLAGFAGAAVADTTFLIWQAVLTSLAVVALKFPRHGRWTFPIAFLASAALAWTPTLWRVAAELTRHEQLRAQYGTESMAARLPLSPIAQQLADPTRLETFEAAVESDSERQGGRRRLMLERLHRNRVALFVESPAFGRKRMPYFSEWVLPDSRGAERSAMPFATLANADRSAEHSAWVRQALAGAHESGAIDFVNTAGFGIVEGRDAVTGFLPHRMSGRPPFPAEWTPTTLELVGLLLHPEPVVYTAPALPSMVDLKTTLYRSLDDFETDGLAALRGGEDLFLRSAAGGARMLGALRNVKQCVACHGGQRGDLLGAFAYVFPKSLTEPARR